MYRIQKVIWLKALLVWGSVFYGATPSSALSYEEWVYKAYDQVVRAHAMTKSACLVMLGIEAKIHFEYVNHSSEKFLQDMRKLSNPVKGLNEGLDDWQDIAFEVDRMKEFFKPMALSARQISAGDMHSVAMKLLLSRNLQATDRFDRLAHMLMDRVKDFGLTRSEIILFHLRVSSQQVLRDVCLYRAGIGRKQVLKERLFLNSENFTENIARMIKGDKAIQIPKPSNIKIKLRLISVERKWNKFTKLLYPALERDGITTDEMQIFSVLGDSILLELDKAWKQFEVL